MEREGTATKISRKVVCNRKFNRREPGNFARGERKRRAQESGKTNRRRERGGKIRTPEILVDGDSATRVCKWLIEAGAGKGGRRD